MKYFFFLLFFFLGINLFAQDRDSDGLPDEWETRGFGPINPAIHNVNPNRADLFIWVAFRSAGTTRAMVEPEFEKVKQFFSRLSNRNPDGTTGINVIVLYGNVLSAVFANAEYIVPGFYEDCVPAEWRNYAHGYLAEPGEGGAGQTSGRLTAGGYGWRIVVHEMGHQLGLNHEPPNGISSPYYTSLMNYDYCYSFNGNADAVHYSNGAFANLHLRENNLNENIGLPQSELAFLTASPYGFRTRAVDATRSSIDWNRNGIFGETSVAADINDGYSVKIGTASHLNTTSGSPALASVGSSLYLIYPKLQGTLAETWVTAKSELPPGSSGYHLYYQKKRGSVISDEALLLSSSAGSDPSAVGFIDKLVVGFVTRNKVPMISSWISDNAGNLSQRKFCIDLNQTADQVVLAVTGPEIKAPVIFSTNTTPSPGTILVNPGNSGIGNSEITSKERLWMLTWSVTTKEVKLAEVATFTSSSGGESMRVISSSRILASNMPVLSESPIGAVYNRKTQRMFLVTTGTNRGANNSIKLHTLYYENGKGWKHERMEWVGGNSGVQTNMAPAIIVDDLYTLTNGGELCIFIKGNVPTNNNSQIFRLLKIKDPVYPGGWRIKMVRDDWTTTRSAPAIAICGNDLFFALRWCCGEHVLSNRIVLFNKASGIEDVEFMDFDDVTHIATVGLKNFIIR